MSASTAIGRVSESLRNLLVGEMRISPVAPVTILAPDETGGGRRINLFLYQVRENPSFKNMDWQLKSGSDSVLVPPPLSLDLFYLMTAYAQNDAQTGNSTAHEILGEAMRVFFEFPAIPKTYLADGLQDAREHIQIIQNTLDMEELARVWGTFTQPFRLSVLYKVSVVQIDARPESERPMPARVRHIGVAVPQAPYVPPSIDGMSPVQGKAGATVSFQGRHWAGWRATVQVTGRTIVDAMELDHDQFSVALPADLQPGFHQVVVDIARLSRKSFFFEVIP